MENEEYDAEFPIRLQELVKYTFNFDNLIKAVAYLHNKDINLSSFLKDFDKRISALECLKTDIEDIKIQARNIQNANGNLNRSIQIMQERFIKEDFKINEMDKRLSENKNTIEEQDKIIQFHTKNLDHLNKVVEDNIKKTNIIGEDLEENKKQILIIKENINELKQKDKDLESLIHTKNELLNSRIDENKNEIVKINNNIEELNKKLNELKKQMEIKNEEFESSIANIINNISKGNIGKGSNKKEKTNKDEDDNTGLLIKTVNDNILLTSKIAQIEEEQKNFKEFITNYNLDKDNFNNNFKNNENDITNIKNDINNIKNEIEILTKGAYDENNKPKGNIDLSNYATNDVVKKLSDNIKILNSSFTTNPTREEFETSIRKINTRLETIEFIQQGVTSGPRTMINSDLVQKEGTKMTYITTAEKVMIPLKEEGKMKSMDDIKKLILDTLNEEIKNISFLQNPKFSEIFQNLSKCEEEISKNDSSIINIRNILAVSPTQNDIMTIRQDIERLSEESKKKFNEIIRTINGDEEDEDEDEENRSGLAGFCIKKKIEILISKFHELFNKITSVQNKSNALSREIKEEVKQNLKNETLKVVEDFKQKLENFTAKFEIELRNKIDRGGLNIFEDKLNSKLKIDLKEKLDRIELKKNNNIIKRKIDSLENKISKTLVDTIIDLQMDEAPLIVKKNAKNFDLCASCNQPIKKGNNNYLNTDRNFYKGNKNNNSNITGGINSFRNNSNHHVSLSLNMNQTNTNFNNKKLPGIMSYTQSK